MLAEQPVAHSAEGVGHTPGAVVTAAAQMAVTDGDGLTAQGFNFLCTCHLGSVEWPRCRIGLGP